MEDMQVVDAIFLFHFHDKNQSKPRFEISKIIGEILSIFLVSTKANTILPSKFQMSNFHFFFRKYRRYFNIYYGFLYYFLGISRYFWQFFFPRNSQHSQFKSMLDHVNEDLR